MKTILRLLLCAAIALMPLAASAADDIATLRAQAEAGDAEAQCNLGLCYYTGNGVAKDCAEAVKWFRKAAIQGNQTAIANLKRLGITD